MGHAQYGILAALAEAGGTARMGALASLLDFSPSRLAHAVSALERHGWVRRRSCPEDRRGQIAGLTPAGRAAQRAAAPGHVGEVRRLVFDVIPTDEQTVLAAAMNRVLAALDDHHDASTTDS